MKSKSKTLSLFIYFVEHQEEKCSNRYATTPSARRLQEFREKKEIAQQEGAI